MKYRTPCHLSIGTIALCCMLSPVHAVTNATILAPRVRPTATVLTFEELSTPEPVAYFYSPSRGVIFENAMADDDGGSGLARSGTKYVEACWGVEFCRVAITAKFRMDASRVKVWVGYRGPSSPTQQTVILRAFAADGTTQLTQATTLMDTTAGVVPIRIPLEVSAPGIRSVTLGFLDAEDPTTGATNNYLSADDFELDAPPPPGCDAAPTVSVVTPADGAEVDLDTSQPSLVVAGNVTGGNIPAQATVTITNLLPAPHDLTPPDLYSVTLNGAGADRTFSQALRPKLGYQSVRVAVTSECGLTAESTVRLTNLPSRIRIRHDEEGGGPLQWTMASGFCQIAVYATVAFATSSFTQCPSGTCAIYAPTFTKWREWVSKSSHEVTPDYCPRGEVRSASFAADPTWYYQDFGSGRIYYRGSVFAAAVGPYFVPRVFADAIESRGLTNERGDRANATGFPTGDPVKSPAARVWMFQQFRREGSGSEYPDATLEIKGSPPVLHVQRRGGDLLTISDPPNGTTCPWNPYSARCADVTNETATISEAFPCASSRGPCDMAQPPGRPRIPRESASATCRNTTFVNVGVQPRAWEPAPGTSDCDTTTAVGFVDESGLAGEDLATVHDTSYECTFSGSKGVAYDWTFHLKPLNEGPVEASSDPVYGQKYQYVLAQNEKLEVEIEACHMMHFSWDAVGVGLRRGGLLQTSGRWIIDCGHDNYASEVHPPGLIAYSRSGTDPLSNYCQGPVTLTTISTNGFWPGLPTSVLMTPPPRTAPNAFLCLHYPTDSEASVGVNPVAWTTDADYSTYVLATLSKPTPQCPSVNTSYGGRMYPLVPSQRPEGGVGPVPIQQGEYYGLWVLGWQTDPGYAVAPFDY